MCLMCPMRWCPVVFLFGLAIIGCGGGGPKEEVIHIKPAADPLDPAKTILERYAAGQPMTSEVTAFPKIVEDLRAADSAKADILEKGLEDLKRTSPGSLPGKAKALLDQLQSK